MPHARRVPLGGSSQILHAVVDHLHHVPALHGQQAGVGRKIGGEILLAAKCAARLGLNHAHLVIGQIEHRAQRLVHVERALQRAPDRDAALPIPFRDHSVVLNVQMFLRTGTVLSLDNVRRVGPRGIHIALFKQEALDHIVLAEDNHILLFALLDGEHRGQRIVLDAHRVHGFAQLVPVRMRQEQNRLIAVVHLSIGQARLVGHDELNVILAGHIRRGRDGELAPVDAWVELNGADDAPWNCAANRRPEPHSFAFHVVHIQRAAD